MIPVVLTAVLSELQNQLSFTFLFIAPQLFVVHAVLSSLLTSVNIWGGRIFSGGAIEMAS